MIEPFYNHHVLVQGSHGNYAIRSWIFTEA